MKNEESVTDYIVRAETAASRLKSAKEDISDQLLIAMVMKGLPDSFKAFTTLIYNSDAISFAEFKIKLRNYEENEASRSAHSSTQDNIFELKCFHCGKNGHSKQNCRSKFNYKAEGSQSSGFSSRKGCNICGKTNHIAKHCFYRKNNNNNRNKSYNIEDDNDGADKSFIFNIEGFEDDTTQENQGYLIDCGATTHIVNDLKYFVRTDKNFNHKGHTIQLADNSRQTGLVVAKGDAKIHLHDSRGKLREVILKDTLCIPKFKQNILSVTARGMKIIFTNQENKIITPDGTVFYMKKHGKLYYVKNIADKKEETQEENIEVKTKMIKHSLFEWHKILGHCNVQDIVNLAKLNPTIKITDKTPFDCESCIKGKMTQSINHNEDSKAQKPFDLVHTDVAGPIEPASLEGSRFCICFVDDYSGVTYLYFMKNKSDSVKATLRFLSDISPMGINVKTIKSNVKAIRSDNGGEYTSQAYADLLLSKNIKHEYTAPYSPHQNGTAERCWRTIFNTARCILIENNLPKYLWNYAVRHASMIRNRCYSRQRRMSPYEKLTGKKFDYGRLHEFGSKCFYYVHLKTKLDDRAKEGIFIGMDPCSPAYLVFLREEKKIIRARNVHFSKPKNLTIENPQDVTYYPINIKSTNQSKRKTHHPSENSSDDSSNYDDPNSSFSGEEEEEQKNPDAARLPGDPEGGVRLESPVLKPSPEEKKVGAISKQYPTRERKLPRHLNEYHVYNSNDNVSNMSCYNTSTCKSDESEDSYFDVVCRVSDIPCSYEEAISSSNSDMWQAAMDEEISSLQAMDTYEFAVKPDRKVIGGRWIFAMKSNENNQEIFKARYVARGFSQTRDIDYSETFSPTARMTTIRTLMQFAVNENMNLFQLDVKTAYLNAPIDCELYMEQPAGYIKYDAKGNKLVWRLKKSLYGLKQSGRLWNSLLHDFLIMKGFTQSISDYCLYTKNSKDQKIILVIWVDDIILATTSHDDAVAIKSMLSERFKMKDFGIVSNFLGIEFIIESQMIKMHQSSYVSKILEKFKMLDCNPKLIPCDASVVKSDFDYQSPMLDDPCLYRQIVGSLIYLMMCTRPDICYIVSVLSQHMAKPTMAHLNMAKYTMRYIKGTQDKGLVYAPCNVDFIYGYTDASWASSADRKSISGYCYQFSDNALISWKSKKQPIVALSSCESEYVATSYAVQEGIFLQNLSKDMGLFSEIAVVKLYVDNQGSIALSKNPVYHQRSKHIDTRFHFIRSKVADGTFMLIYVPSKLNVADMFTKPCSSQSLKLFNVVK